MTIWFRVDFHSGEPIYVQIKDGMKDMIANSIVKPGDSIPSVREFARILGVNVNTVARAYRELEIEGVIVSKKGVGYFVNVDEKKIKKMLMEELKGKLKNPLKKLGELGFSKEEILDIISEILSEVEGWES